MIIQANTEHINGMLASILNIFRDKETEKTKERGNEI